MRSLIGALRSLLARARFEREMREEFTLHIERRADDLAARGMPREDALRQARVEFGGLESYKEQCRDASGFVPARVLHGLGADVTVACRRLLATPAFTAFAMLSLAVGVGVTSAVYSVVDRIFLEKLDIPEPDRVVFVMSGEAGRFDPGRAMSEPDFDDLRGAQECFSDLAASSVIYPAVRTSGVTEIQFGEAVDASYFRLFGVAPLLGRTLQASDANLHVVVLGYELWRTGFASSRTVIGQTVHLSGHPFEIVGVMPASFHGPASRLGIGTRLWLPRAAVTVLNPRNPASTVPERERRGLMVLGRLKPGLSVKQAAAEMASLGANLDRAYPRTRSVQPGVPTGRAWRVAGLREQNHETETMHRMGLALLALVALVLVVACTNLANLVLARGTARHQEFAVRRALGASRWRLVRQQVAESLILASGGGLLSWLVVQAMMRTLDVDLPLAQSFLISIRPHLDRGVLVIAGVATLLSLLVFGLEPAMQLTRTEDVRQQLGTGAGSVGLPKARRHRRLLTWQVAISTGFFIMASLSVRYVMNQATYDSGLDLERMGVAHVDFYIQRWDETRARRVLQAVIDEARREPGIESVSASTGLPFGTMLTPHASVSTHDKPLTGSDDDKRSMLLAVSPDFFRTTGVSIRRGRGFDDRDAGGATPVVVLSETTARTVFGTTDAVGGQLQMKVDRNFIPQAAEQAVKTVTVVGVAEDTDVTHYGSRGRSRTGDVMYTPLAQQYSPILTIVARAGDPAAAVRALKSAVRRADVDLALTQAGTADSMLAPRYSLAQSVSVGTLSLGAITLLLAMVGLYGVQSHIVAHRTREIGVRMSFGASAWQIRRMVLKDGYKPVLQGLAIGIFIGLACRVLVRSAFDVRVAVIDPWMLAVVPIPLVLAALCACYLPARRASRVDPNVALREL